MGHSKGPSEQDIQRRIEEILETFDDTESDIFSLYYTGESAEKLAKIFEKDIETIQEILQRNAAELERQLALPASWLGARSFDDAMRDIWPYKVPEEEIKAGWEETKRKLAEVLEQYDNGFRSLYHNDLEHSEALRDLQVLAAIRELGGRAAFDKVSAIVNGWSSYDVKPAFVYAALDRLAATRAIASDFAESGERNFTITETGTLRLETANANALARATGEEWDDSDPAAWGLTAEDLAEREKPKDKVPSTVRKILKQLEHASGMFERQTVEKALRRETEIVPELMRILESVIQVLETSPERYETEIDPRGDYTAHLYAILLLGEFEYAEALPLLLRFARLPEFVLESALGRFDSELMRAVELTGVDAETLATLMVNPDVSMVVRLDAGEGIVRMVEDKAMSREAGIDLFRRFYYGGLERKPSRFWGCLVLMTISIDSGAELLPEIRQAYDEGLFKPPDDLTIDEFMEEVLENTADSRSDINVGELMRVAHAKPDHFSRFNKPGPSPWWEPRNR